LQFIDIVVHHVWTITININGNFYNSNLFFFKLEWKVGKSWN